MRVEVLQVISPERKIVSFMCDFGSAFARWMGVDPVGAGEFNVEIEVPEEVAAWSVTSSDRASISSLDENSNILIVGEVVRFDEGDPVVEVRVGTDIILIEMKHPRDGLSVNGFISFKVPEIQLYPYNI
ncbi:hypothetical protein [Streptomyces sp. NPDC002599]|uniref:hypothetical protein n=1 Tax=Streptomyces sp. NPDC002599 TaxID=3154421 RepID=UPI0033301418